MESKDQFSKPQTEDQSDESNFLMEELKCIAGSPDFIGSISVVEILFNKIPNVTALKNVHNLIELTLIGTSTSSLQGVEYVGHSLEMLNATNCNLTKIEPCFLKLINLRHLNLGENQITSIDNLQHCIQLEKLFLYMNQVKKVENLDCNLSLKELHLQSNQLKRLENISRLVNLQLLYLSENPIDNFDSVSEVSKLPNLIQLSFQCEHFMSCPLTDLPGYKSYILSTISSKQSFNKLDNEWITQEDFQGAQNEFMEQILKLQESLQEIENDHRHQLFTIDSKYQENEDHLKKMQVEILHEVDNLKSEVSEGRKKINDDIDKNKRLREDNFEQLKYDFSQIKDQLDKEVQKIVKQEEQSEEQQLQRCKQEIARLEFEKEVHLCLIDVVYESQGAIIFNEIQQETIEFKFFTDIIDSHCSKETIVINGQTYNNMNKKSSKSNQINYESVIELKKVFMINESKKHMNQFNNNQRYFIRVNGEQIKDILLGRLAINRGQLKSQDSKGLQGNPQKGSATKIGQMQDSESSSMLRNSQNLIFMNFSNMIKGQINKCYESEASCQYPQQNESIIVIKISNEVFQKYQNEINMIQSIETSNDLNSILIEAVLVLQICSSKENIESILKQRSFDNSLVDLLANNSNDSKLNQIEQQIYQKYIEMEKRSWGEMDPQSILIYQGQQQEIGRLKDETFQLQGQIDKERLNQENVLKELRLHLIDNTNRSTSSNFNQGSQNPKKQ